MNKLYVNEYSPASDLHHPKRLLTKMLMDLWRGRGLAWRLFVRDVKAQYRQTLLGLLWVFLPPVATTVAFVLLNKGKLLSSPEGLTVPYSVFVLVGTLFWQTFADALNSPLRILTQSGSMLVKINFPRESLILAAMLHTGFNSCVRLMIMVPIFVYYNLVFQPSVLMSLLPLFILLFMGTVAGVIISPFGILFHDVQKSLPLILNFWMLLTPVIYAAPSGGFLGVIVKHNPVTPFVVAGRNWILDGFGYIDTTFVTVAAVTLALAIWGWVVFRISLPIIIERMQA
jgi:lipopolysaccharide transport system permease protein